MRPDESFVGQPVRSLQTMLRVIAKDEQRLPTLIPDGIYGPSTMNAVAAFQRLYSLPPTGITDQTTWDLVAETFAEARTRVEKAEPIEILLEPGQIIAAGDVHPYIYLLQGMLTYLSETNGGISEPGFSGILDAQTSGSVASFQKIAALEETGNVDRVTWQYLVKHFNLNVHANNQTF